MMNLPAASDFKGAAHSLGFSAAQNLCLSFFVLAAVSIWPNGLLAFYALRAYARIVCRNMLCVYKHDGKFFRISSPLSRPEISFL